MNTIRICLIALSTSVLSMAAFSQPSANAQVEPTRVGKASQLFEQLQAWGEQLHEVRENRKLEKARDAARATVPKNETRQFEVVTKGGTIPEGGKFVRIQPHVEGNTLKTTGEVVSQPFGIGGGLELPGSALTPAQKKEMTEKAQRAMKAEQDVKDAEELQRKVREANEAAEKARQAAEELQRKVREANEAAEKVRQAAEEQKRLADEAAKIAAARRAEQARAEKAAQIAALDEAKAMRDGARVQERIASERARYRAEGGPFRAPASGGGGH